MAKVAVSRCQNYELETVIAALRECLALIGGLDGFVRPGQRVLIKISMLLAATPERAVVTHPAIAVGLSLLVREAGGVPVIGDSCGGSDYGLSERALEETGIGPLARRHDIETVVFETAGSESIDVPNARHLKTIRVSRAVLDADVIISVPKLKTHIETLMTGGVKNLLGCLPGAAKLIVHRIAPSPDDLGHALLDIYGALRPQLTVMDGVVAMAGNGPSKGVPHPVGLVLASADAVALDHVAARIIGYRPELIPTIAPAFERGLGENRAANIDILGVPLEEAKAVGFKLCSNTMMRTMPKWLLRLLNRYFFVVRPAWNDAGCTRCGLCERSCPVAAITIADDRLAINREECTECFCCYELCPDQGIQVKKSLLVRLLSG